MSFRLSVLFVCILTGITISGCKQTSVQVVELRHFPLDSTEGIITKSGVEFDRDISSDGNGSIRITPESSSIVRLFEISDIDVEDARLIYRARVRTERVEGQVYLEMWCGFKGVGEFFSRSLDRPLSGTTEWTTVETPFFLQKGQNPEYVKLNLVVDGRGTAWIDDIRLFKGPLN
jgi:hypothetical protein